MHRTHPTAAIALAACAFALPALATDAATITLQLTPDGDFSPSDGRQLDVPHWHIDQAAAAKVIARFKQRATATVVDYEHQTLNKEANGQPAPAAGWFKDLQWHDGQGLFAVVELTARAAQHIAAGEYRYVSPVFAYDRRTGTVLDIRMAAITNAPAIDGMAPLALRAAATFGYTQQEDAPMNKLLAAVIAALTLSADTTEDQAVAALTAHLKADPLAKVRTALGVAAGAGEDAIVTACTALATARPDPAKYVEVAVLDQVKTDLAALTAKVQGDEVDKAVTAGLADGRLIKAQEGWARELGKKDLAALTAYLATAQPIAALTATQTRGRQPLAQADDSGLTADELAVCSATGITPKDFAAAKKAA